MVTGTQDAHGEPPELAGMMDGDWNRIGGSRVAKNGGPNISG